MKIEMKNVENLVDYPALPQTIKIWLTSFLIVMGLAYCLAILNVYANTGMTYKGVADK